MTDEDQPGNHKSSPWALDSGEQARCHQNLTLQFDGYENLPSSNSSWLL